MAISVISFFQNAAYLARIGLDVTGAVLKSLNNFGSTKKVMIQSSNSSVLEEFKAEKSYELVYYIDELVQDVLNSTIQDIKSFADSVVLKKSSIFLDHSSFLTRATDTVQKFHSFGIPVYAKLFANEFVSQAWDFFSDAHVELNAFVQGGEIDGIITGFPKTAATYKSKSRSVMLHNHIYASSLYLKQYT